MSFAENKGRRTWKPNVTPPAPYSPQIPHPRCSPEPSICASSQVHWAKLWSDTLGKCVRVPATAAALKCIDNKGGLDECVT